MARDPKSNFNNEDWDELLSLEENKQQEKVDEKWVSNKADDDPGYSERLLLGDIEKTCQNCRDTECFEGFKRARSEDDFEQWDACPKIHHLLNS